jgi:hypothetical protein
MAKRLLRGRFRHGWAQDLVSAAEACDRIVLTLAPFLRRYCGEVLIIAKK